MFEIITEIDSLCKVTIKDSSWPIILTFMSTEKIDV